MEKVLLVIHLMLALAMIVVILAQRTAQDGGGLTGGGSGGTMGGLFTARGSANLLTRTTAILATLFIVTSLVLAFLVSHQHTSKNPLDAVLPITAPAGDAPATTPAADAGKDTTPAAPATPQVPVSK